VKNGNEGRGPSRDTSSLRIADAPGGRETKKLRPGKSVVQKDIGEVGRKDLLDWR